MSPHPSVARVNPSHPSHVPSRASVSIAVLFATAVAAGCGHSNQTTGPSPVPVPNSTIYYTAIGASDAIGIGASVSCIPWVDCPNGRGYVQVTARELTTRGFTVSLNNLGL